jgi:DNA-binding XRE family transcriptional regulator
MHQPTAKPSTTENREVRSRLHLSQPQFAALLGVSTETYRTWDSGRRLVPDAWLDKARAVAAINDPDRLWSLQELATNSAFMFGRCEMPRAPVGLRSSTKTVSCFAIRYPERRWRPVGSSWSDILQTVVLAIRIKASHARAAYCPFRLESSTCADPTRTRLTQARLAEQIGAAGKAVVYQGESRKRKPSPAFWSPEAANSSPDWTSTRVQIAGVQPAVLAAVEWGGVSLKTVHARGIPRAIVGPDVLNA